RTSHSVPTRRSSDLCRQCNASENCPLPNSDTACRGSDFRIDLAKSGIDGHDHERERDKHVCCHHTGEGKGKFPAKKIQDWGKESRSEERRVGKEWITRS